MQSIDNLMDAVAKYLSDSKQIPGEFLFSKIDLKYAYSQIPLHPTIQKHCNFNILGGKSTGTYRFINGFYGLSDMPAIFQKTIDKTLENIPNKFNFLDDILIITKGTIADHVSDIKLILKRLDEENLAIKLEKCKFAKQNITWLGYNITQSGISPNDKKTDSIKSLEPPKTLKQLRSLMGSIHQLIKFIPNLASLLDPIRPLLKKENIVNNKIKWSNEHTDALNNIKNKISKITEQKHFDKEKPTRVKCDASHKGIGATLEQWDHRFLNTAEQKYSTNELELLAVVWATEHFRYYLYGSDFTIATDHQALLSALKSNRGNKSNFSRLTRWVDRLLPFTFKIQHIPGTQMGFTDYLSRHPHSPASKISKDDELFVVNRINDINFTINDEFRHHALSANNIATQKPLQPDEVINHAQNLRTKQSAFCLNSNSVQLPLTHSISNSNSSSEIIPTLSQLHSSKINSSSSYTITKNIQTNKRNINAITRQNPKRNTSDITIQRRHRAPNKNKMDTTDMNSKSTQTDNQEASNIGRGREPILEEKHQPLFKFTEQPTPEYRHKLQQVLGEAFLAEATAKDKNLLNIIRIVEKQDWDELKQVSKYYYNIRRDLGISPSRCLLYDGKLVTPYQLQNTIINTVHRTHPGQVGMIRLANLIWFPHIHRTIKLRAENCKQCTDQGKNLKPIIPKTDLGKLPKLLEPNQEIQLYFAGPLPNESNNEIYILVAVDRFSRYPSAVVHPNCDASTAIDFLQKYCEFHGIPRSIRCDQAQAFKSKSFDVYCKNKNIKLIFSPTHDHRATGMVERLIQTLKRRLASMISDPIWSNTTIAEKISAIIESIKLIPNRVTKITPLEAHFGRPPNTEISNIVTKPNKNNLTYKIKSFYLDKKLLQHAALTPSDIWDNDANSEANLNIQYQERRDSSGAESGSETGSDNTPVGKLAQRGTIIPSKISFQLGDKTTTIDQTRKNLARKTIRRRVPEPRGTLKPLWAIIPDGTITNYTPLL